MSGPIRRGALDPTLPVGPQIVEKLRAVAPEVDRIEARGRVVALLDAVRIPSAATRFHDFPSQFSGGMMQRALIVDALVSNPAFLVADNITQPLDVTVAAQVLAPAARADRTLWNRHRLHLVLAANRLRRGGKYHRPQCRPRGRAAGQPGADGKARASLYGRPRRADAEDLERSDRAPPTRAKCGLGDQRARHLALLPCAPAR